MAASSVEEAEAALQRRAYDEALKLFAKVLAEDARNAKALAGRAASHLKLKDYVQAVADATAALEEDPSLASAEIARGHAHFNLEEYEKAREAFRRATELEPAKKVHQEWVKMCTVRLGEPLPKESPTLSSMPLPSLASFQPTSSKTTALPVAARVDDSEYSKYWGSRKEVANAAPAPEPKPSQQVRHQWIQTPGQVEVAVLVKGLTLEQVRVEFQPRKLDVSISASSHMNPVQLHFALWGTIDSEASRWSLLSSKLEIRLVKTSQEHWADLTSGNSDVTEAALPSQPAQASPAVTDASTSVPYPYAGKKVDWSQIERQIAAEEGSEKVEGMDGALQFFQSLYSGGDDDFKKAMMKSYVESGGRALSTNWGEVEHRDYAEKEKKEESDDEA